MEEVDQHIPTADDLKIVSRLVLNKILSCDAVRYLRHKSIERVREMMISPDPHKDVTLSYTDDEEEKHSTSQRYYGTGTCELTIQWTLDPNEIIDSDGNVWHSYVLNVSSCISSAYSLDDKQIASKVSVISAVSRLATEIREMVPYSLKIRALNDVQRLARDEQRRIERVNEICIKVFSSLQRKLRTGLRVGGKARSFKREDVLPGVLPGTYKFEINDGSRWSSRGIKRYTVYIPDNLSYLCTIKRT